MAKSFMDAPIEIVDGVYVKKLDRPYMFCGDYTGRWWRTDVVGMGYRHFAVTRLNLLLLGLKIEDLG